MSTSEDRIIQDHTSEQVWSARLSFDLGTWVLIVVVSHDPTTNYVPVKSEVFPKLKVAQTP